jgi:hypothetical protein
VVLLRFRVEIGLARRKQQVDAGGGELVAVILQGTRIEVEVVTGSELQTVDENAGDDGIAVRARLGHQRDVAGVQVAHGGYENDPATIRQRPTQLRDLGVNLHTLTEGVYSCESRKERFAGRGFFCYGHQ